MTTEKTNLDPLLMIEHLEKNLVRAQVLLFNMLLPYVENRRTYDMMMARRFLRETSTDLAMKLDSAWRERRNQNGNGENVPDSV